MRKNAGCSSTSASSISSVTAAAATTSATPPRMKIPETSAARISCVKLPACRISPAPPTDAMKMTKPAHHRPTAAWNARKSSPAKTPPPPWNQPERIFVHATAVPVTRNISSGDPATSENAMLPTPSASKTSVGPIAPLVSSRSTTPRASAGARVEK